MAGVVGSSCLTGDALLDDKLIVVGKGNHTSKLIFTMRWNCDSTGNIYRLHATYIL